MTKPIIAIIVEGGVVQDVMVDGELETDIILIDRDNDPGEQIFEYDLDPISDEIRQEIAEGNRNIVIWEFPA